MVKKAILITLFLCLAGFVHAQPVMPTEPFYLESYNMPGWFMTSTDSGTSRPVQLVQGKTPEGLWLVDEPFTGDPDTTISLTPVAQPGNYVRHSNWVLYTDPEESGEGYAGDASWHHRAGLANPSDPTLVSFEEARWGGNYIQQNPEGDPIGFGAQGIPADQGLATFRIVLLREKGKAYDPEPIDKEPAADIEPILSWKSGDYITEGGTHNIFFGTDFNDVSGSTITELLGTTISKVQVADDTDFDPGTLYTIEFGKTYYWRVDEVNAIDTGEYKGQVWSFTVEDEALKLPYQNITVKAIGSTTGLDANDTVNEVGLDPNSEDMLEHFAGTGFWTSIRVDDNDVWIQYNFDKKYKLHEMLVWNYNQNTILSRYGFKDVLIQYSEDGNDTWIDMNDVNDVQQFNQASGEDGYKPNTTVSFNDLAIKSVRITAISNWGGGGSWNKYGLSEVRFTYIPVRAKLISPKDKSNLALATTLKWRKGREAVTHNVYIDINEAAVRNGTSAYYDVNESSYSVTLKLGKTYYWRVDEVNSTMTPDVWEGDEIWSFSTISSILIDGFETGYGDTSSDAVYLTWEDGGDPGSSANGSWMGRHTQPYLQTINHSGGHSSPMEFGRNGANDSWVTAQTVNLPIGTSDWSIGSPSTLTIWFRGDPNNSTTVLGDHKLYCTIGGQTKDYEGNLKAYLNLSDWKQFDIDLAGLASLGVDLSNIPEITIGVRKVGTNTDTGVIYFDDISLSGLTPVIAKPSIWIEAETASITDGMVIDTTTTGYLGTGYITSDPDLTEDQLTAPPTQGIATYTFDIKNEGDYKIGFLTSLDRNAGNSFWVKVTGPSVVIDQSLDPNNSGWIIMNEITRPPWGPWTWEDVFELAPGTVKNYITFTLTPGEYTLQVAVRELTPRLDAIEIKEQ